MHDLREGFDPLFFSLDIDECSTNSHSCDVNAVCSNNVGSYACACKAGFTGDGYTCTGEPFKSNVKRLFDMFVFICTLLALPIKFLVRWEKITVKMTGWSKRTDKQLIKIKYRRQLYKSWIWRHPMDKLQPV